jgi:hypothetical protein
MHGFMSARVLHGYRYIGVTDAARLIRSIPKTCHTRPYIECIVTYNEAVDVCSKFADALRDPSLRDLDTFMATYDRQAVTDDAYDADNADDAYDAYDADDEEPFTVQTHSEGAD